MLDLDNVRLPVFALQNKSWHEISRELSSVNLERFSHARPFRLGFSAETVVMKFFNFSLELIDSGQMFEALNLIENEVSFLLQP